MRWIALLLLSLVMPGCAVAQKTEDEIKARLVGRPLYLRGQWSKDKLDFDGHGQSDRVLPPAPFTISGIDIRTVKLDSKELVLEGQRAGLEFTKDVPSRVDLEVSKGLGGTEPEKMTIRIRRPDDGDFTAALDAIFTESLAGLSSPMPAYWSRFAVKHLLPPDPLGAPVAPSSVSGGADRDSSAAPPSSSQLDKVGGGVTSPVVIHTAEPGFSPSARALRYQGAVLVNLIVDVSGTPAMVTVLRPAGLGLDEAAVAAVSQYRFKPAMWNGKPVAVELNVEVNFQIF